MMEQDRTMFGVNYNSHKNVWIYSLDTPNILQEVENKAGMPTDEIPVRKRFTTWVFENYEDILSANQISYLNDVLEGREDEHKRQQRLKYRIRMQNRLMRAYFNGHYIQYYRRLEYDIEKLNILRKLRRKGKDNKEFVSYILDNLDTNYINELVYGTRISSKAFKHLMYSMNNPEYIPNAAILNEIYNLVLEDIETTKQNIFCHKS